MLRKNAIRRVLGFAILLSGLSHPMTGQARSAPERSLALKGGTIYAGPAESPITNGVVFIREGKIAAVGGRGSVKVPKDVPALNCSGLTIVAGFWNSHIHLFERKWADAANIPAPELAGQLQTMLTRYGFTSAFDTGSAWENTRRIRDRIESGEIAGPRLELSGFQAA